MTAQASRRDRSPEEWHAAADGRITCRFGPFSADTCSERTLLRVKELAEARGLG